MTQLTCDKSDCDKSDNPKRDAVQSVHREAREAPGDRPTHLLLASFAARLESVGFGQTDDERLVLTWVRRSARLPHAPTETTTMQFAAAWFRVLAQYGINKDSPRVAAS